MSREKILEAATQLRKAYTDGNQPLGTIFKRICKDRKISIEYGDDEHALKTKDGWKIVLRRDTSGARDNFTIAHEIGHIVLGHPVDNEDKVHRTAERTPDEIDADYFAAEFLMPKDEFIKAANDLDFDECKLSEKFEVSKTAVLVRMSVLNIG